MLNQMGKLANGSPLRVFHTRKGESFWIITLLMALNKRPLIVASQRFHLSIREVIDYPKTIIESFSL